MKPLILVSALLFGFLLIGPPTQSFDQYQDNNFTINTNDPTLTHEVGNLVYPMSHQIIKKWLDGPIPQGMRHITITIRIRPWTRAYCTMTGHPKIYIECPREKLPKILKHELTHALLAIRYPGLPRWTHEGAASHYDAKGHQKMYASILAWSRKSGTYPKLQEIMQGVRFNSHNSTAYTASNSLVKFLLSKRDRYTLFLYATQRVTLERAYGLRTIQDLQDAWVKWLNAPVEAKKPL